MQIPQEIKAVERPKNTVVRNYFGKYKVVKRTCKNINKKPTPVDKEIVGEIIDFKFVPYDLPIPVGTKKRMLKNKLMKMLISKIMVILHCSLMIVMISLMI